MKQASSIWTASLLVAFCVISSGCYQERNESIRLMNQGLKFSKMNKHTRAIEFLRNAYQVDPTNHRAYFYEGMIRTQRLGESDKAEPLLRKAIEHNDRTPEYHYQLGVVLTDKRHWEDAASAFTRALELDPEHAESHLRLGVAYENLSQPDNAQRAYREAIKNNGRLPQAYARLGNLYREFGKLSHAAHVFKNGIENNPQYASNYRDLGLVYQNQERYADALGQFNKALTLEPGDSGTLFNIAITHAESGNTQKALVFLGRYLQRRGSEEDPLRVRTAERLEAKLKAQQSSRKKR